MDLQDLLFPLGLGLLTSTFSVLLAIYLNVVPYALQFPLFVFSIISLALSLILVALDFVYTWPIEEEPCQTYPYRPIGKSLERPSGHATVRTNSQKAKTVNVDPPTREELQQLKEMLGIEKGSLQYKRRGAGIYLVTYERGKHVWKYLGSWIRLKEKLKEKISPN